MTVSSYFVIVPGLSSSGWWVDIHLFEQILIGRTIAVLLSKEKQHFLVHYFRGTGGTHAD